MAKWILLHYKDIWAFFPSSPPVRLPVISELHHHTSSYIPHSTGLDFPEWRLQLSSKECRYQRQSQIQSFFQRYPVQTCIHSYCLVLQQTPPPGQSSGCEVGQKSERKYCKTSGIPHSAFTNANEIRDLPPNQKHHVNKSYEYQLGAWVSRSLQINVSESLH